MSAKSSKQDHLAYFGAAVLVLLLTLIDQGTKLLAVINLKEQPDIALIPGVMQLKYLENRGMAFGLLQGKIPVFVILCILFLGIFFYVYAKIPKTAYYLPLILTGIFMVSGAVGNCIDRIFRGYVVDFLYFSLIDFPIFNVADIYVVCSGILLVLLVCFKYKNDEDYDFLSKKKTKESNRDKIDKDK